MPKTDGRNKGPGALPEFAGGNIILYTAPPVRE
jgi:hypothetical protein